MFRKYSLKPAVWHRKPLVFEWDADTGEVRGPGAETVLGIVASAVKEGGVVGHPYPTSYDITDPLHNATEMAVLLGQDWMLSGDLSYPEAEADDDKVVLIDENGTEKDMSEEILH